MLLYFQERSNDLVSESALINGCTELAKPISRITAVLVKAALRVLSMGPQGQRRKGKELFRKLGLWLKYMDSVACAQKWLFD